MKIIVIGSGSWGTALANVLANNNHEVMIYGNDANQIDDINNYHLNSKFFDDIKLNNNIKATLDIKTVNDYEIVLIAVPTKVVEMVLNDLNKIINEPKLFINVSKGFYPLTNERPSQVIKRCIDKEKRSGVVSLIGPSFANEVICDMLTTIDAVSEDINAAKIVQQIFSNHYFRVYTETDIIGAETGAALKNVIAIATGMADGLSLGTNAKAGLITRGLAEITRFGVALGGDPKTFLGLTGVGDLILTCTSKQSRNFTCGYEIGKANAVEPFYQKNNKTVEGINTCNVIYNYAKKLKVDMPITNAMYKVLFEGLKPIDCIEVLMNRELKSEHEL